MSNKFQPPPTWALPILVDEKTQRAIFNPVWLKWFVDLSANLGSTTSTSGGAGTATGRGSSGISTSQTLQLTGDATSVATLLTAGSIAVTVPALASAVSGPAAATDNALARFDGATGKLIQNSVVTLSDAGDAAGLNSTRYLTSPTGVPTTVGTVAWDGGTTLGVQMTTNVLGNINEDMYYYIKSDAAITKGQVIMFSGAVGASGVVKGKPATGVTDGSYIMGIAAENIAFPGFGLVQFGGTIKGVDTSAFADGDILWYDTAVTGGLTKTQIGRAHV